jgi:hypothetical protein
MMLKQAFIAFFTEPPGYVNTFAKTFAKTAENICTPAAPLLTQKNTYHTS